MRGLLLLLGACSFHLPGGQNNGGDGPPPNDGPPIDGPPIDDVVPPADGCTTFSTQFDTCTVTFSVAVNIGKDQIYNTDTHQLADFPSGNNATTLDATQQIDIAGKGGPINIWLATTAQIGGGHTLRVVGSKPFGIVASDKITIDGLIDGSSGGGLQGAGSLQPSSCPGAVPMPPGAHVGGAAGGGGGAYQGNGGHGGDSDSNEGGETGGAGGADFAEPPGPRGGCQGARGGNTGGSPTGGAGGLGGGAIYLVSATVIEVHAAGAVNAGGGGGGGGKNTDGGGGGGGSGGMIVLEGPQVKIDGTLAANGGGGGGGAGGITAGGPGTAGLPSATAALGGTSASNATPGVAGSAGVLLDGSSNTAQRLTAAGGGGGGGAGYISIVSGNITGGGPISPPQTTLP